MALQISGTGYTPSLGKVPSQEISDILLAGLKETEMEKEEKKETKHKKKK